jgi:hypothetical protein
MLGRFLLRTGGRLAVAAEQDRARTGGAPVKVEDVVFIGESHAGYSV